MAAAPVLLLLAAALAQGVSRGLCVDETTLIQASVRIVQDTELSASDTAAWQGSSFVDARADAYREMHPDLIRQLHVSQVNVPAHIDIDVAKTRTALHAIRALQQSSTAPGHEEGRNASSKTSSLGFPSDAIRALLGDLAAEDFMALLYEIRVLTQDETLMASIRNAAAEIEQEARQYEVAMEALVTKFVNRSAAQNSSAAIVPLVAAVFGGMSEVMFEHRLSLFAAVRKTVHYHVTNETIGKFLHATGLFRHHFTVEDLSATTDPDDVCDAISLVMENVTSFSDLSLVKKVINSTGKALPLMKDCTKPQELEFVASLLDIGMIEVESLERAADDILKRVGPVVRDRLACVWDGDGDAAVSRWGRVGPLSWLLPLGLALVHLLGCEPEAPVAASHTRRQTRETSI